MVRSPFAVGSRVDHVFVPAGEIRPGDGDLLRSELDGLSRGGLFGLTRSSSIHART
jgi:hypothetical protein